METHRHTGLDQPRVDSRDLIGFPIYSSAPTHEAENGTIIFYYDGSTSYKMYVRINNAWKNVTLS